MNNMDLPVVTYEEVVKMEPCWLHTDNGKRRLKRYSDKLGGKATALDILALQRIPASDRLWLVLREELLPANILHEFACRCAEKALSLIADPDPRSVAAIEAKRAWLNGEISDSDLNAARAAAHVAAYVAAYGAARAAAHVAAYVAAYGAARAAAHDAAQKDQINMLINLINEKAAARGEDTDDSEQRK